MGKEHSIENLIGEDAAKKLREAFGGDKIYVAKSYGDMKRKRALELARKGYTIRRIARAMQLSNRQVYRLIKQVNQ